MDLHAATIDTSLKKHQELMATYQELLTLANDSSSGARRLKKSRTQVPTSDDTACTRLKDQLTDIKQVSGKLKGCLYQSVCEIDISICPEWIAY